MSKSESYSHNEVFGDIVTYAFSRKESLDYLGVNTDLYKDLYGDGFTLGTLRSLKFILKNCYPEELADLSFKELTLLESAIVGKINEQQFNMFNAEMSGFKQGEEHMESLSSSVSKLLNMLGRIHNIIGSTALERCKLVVRNND